MFKKQVSLKKEGNGYSYIANFGEKFTECFEFIGPEGEQRRFRLFRNTRLFGDLSSGEVANDICYYACKAFAQLYADESGAELVDTIHPAQSSAKSIPLDLSKVPNADRVPHQLYREIRDIKALAQSEQGTPRIQDSMIFRARRGLPHSSMGREAND